MLINFWSQVTLVGEIMEHREICVRWKWKGRNSCVVLSSVVSVTFYELWTPMITWVYPIERQRLQVKWTYWFSTQWFRFTLEMEPPFKAERVFFTLPLKNNSASCSNLSPWPYFLKFVIHTRGQIWVEIGGVLHQYLGIGERHWGFETLTLFRIKKSPKIHPLFSKTNLSLLPCLGQKTKCILSCFNAIYWQLL